MGRRPPASSSKSSLYAPSAGGERSSGGACVSSSGVGRAARRGGSRVNANAPALGTGASWGCVHTGGKEPSCSFVEGTSTSTPGRRRNSLPLARPRSRRRSRKTHHSRPCSRSTRYIRAHTRGRVRRLREQARMSHPRNTCPSCLAARRSLRRTAPRTPRPRGAAELCVILDITHTPYDAIAASPGRPSSRRRSPPDKRTALASKHQKPLPGTPPPPQPPAHKRHRRSTSKINR